MISWSARRFFRRRNGKVADDAKRSFEFPPRQRPASFTVGGQMEALEKALSRLEADMQ
jgi:hypothetical protein